MDEQLTISSRYELGERLGKGTYGSVYAAKDTSTDEQVALKNIKALFDDETEAKHMLREMLILRTLDHPSIVKISNIFLPPGSTDFNSVYIAMEHAETDLKKMLKSSRFLTPDQVKFLMYQAVCGCRYMHSANILHRDLKPANILINLDLSLKICDFGLSRSYRKINQPFQDQVESLNQDDQPQNFKKKVKRVLTGHVVTRWYRAPELILLEKEYGKEMDIWSLGCVFAEMLGMIRENADCHIERSPLFPGRSCFPLSPDLKTQKTRAGYPCSDSDQLNVILDILGTPDDLSFITDSKALRYVQSFPPMEPRSLTEFLPGASELELDLLSKMIKFAPKDRITLDDALEHPYFQGIRDSKMEVLAENPADFIFDNEQELDMGTMRDIFTREIKRYE